ncbi:tol-pal system protein YbgF [Methyloferula stellata]|uniref:tol-pal system protein YbgF n=1 Tax=Methyloferula stellata TaxID=876270 RepID=UPI00036B30B6|nr:tol-pal system protein YbgF [Methyloferula stellata]
MFFPIKVFLPVIGAPLAGLALLGTVAAAEDPLPTSGRLDQLQSQIEGLKSKLQNQFAQGYGYGRPPGNVGGGDDYGGPSYNSPNSPPAQDAAGLDVRVTHLENEIRQINGQIEQMQFAERKLEDALKKFQQDVDFRFQDIGGHGGASHLQKRTDASDSDAVLPPSSSPSATASADLSPNSSPSPLRGHRGDAFDPASDPNAPGAPRQLGSIASTATALPPPEPQRSASRSGTPSIIAEDEGDPNAPLDLSSGRRSSMSSSTPASTTPGAGTAAAPRQIPLTPQAPSATPGTQVATIPAAASPKDEFDSALGYFKQKEYENAEKSFSAFLQKNPKSRMTPDAIYYLGETYYQRGRQREAAEQYLKISTDYSTSGHAPEAMLRLGQSLKALGAKEQACATFIEVTKKYPNAASWVKNSAEKGAQEAKC